MMDLIERPSAWQTVAACLLTVIALGLVAMAVGAAASLLYGLWMELRPEVAGLIGSVLGGYFGVLASAWLCDRWLMRYSGKVVATFIYIVICGGGVVFELLYMPPRWVTVTSLVQICVIAWATHQLFWKAGRFPKRE